MSSTLSTDNLSNAVAALRDATVDSLAAVAADATAAAQAAGLTILPGAIDIDATVVLDEQQISVQQAVARSRRSRTAWRSGVGRRSGRLPACGRRCEEAS